MQNIQVAPWPDGLERAVAELQYKPGWTFALEDVDRDFVDAARTVPIAKGLTFSILVPCNDSYHPDRYRPVHHMHPVPATTYNRASWERWMLDRILETECHEACEYFRFREVDVVVDGLNHHIERRPFAPTHGPGDNPYVVHEQASDLQRSMGYRGVVNQ